MEVPENNAIFDMIDPNGNACSKVKVERDSYIYRNGEIRRWAWGVKPAAPPTAPPKVDRVAMYWGGLLHWCLYFEDDPKFNRPCNTGEFRTVQVLIDGRPLLNPDQLSEKGYSVWAVHGAFHWSCDHGVAWTEQSFETAQIAAHLHALSDGRIPKTVPGDQTSPPVPGADHA